MILYPYIVCPLNTVIFRVPSIPGGHLQHHVLWQREGTAGTSRRARGAMEFMSHANPLVMTDILEGPPRLVHGKPR